MVVGPFIALLVGIKQLWGNTVRLRDLTPVGVTTTRRPFVAPIQGLLFVVDTVNTKPGSAGTVWISNIGIGAR